MMRCCPTTRQCASLLTRSLLHMARARKRITEKTVTEQELEAVLGAVREGRSVKSAVQQTIQHCVNNTERQNEIRQHVQNSRQKTATDCSTRERRC